MEKINIFRPSVSRCFSSKFKHSFRRTLPQCYNNLCTFKRTSEATKFRTNYYSSVSLNSKRYCTSLDEEKIFTINDHDDFEKRVLFNSNPVVVNFHADWCEPCHTLTPKLRAAINATKYVNLAILNCEDHIELVDTFEVKAVPAILAFRQGYIVEKFIGLIDEKELESFIKKLDEFHSNFAKAAHK